MSARVLPIKRRAWERASHNLVLHVPSGTYYVRKFKAGKGELFKTTGETRKTRAQTVADQMISDWLGGKQMSARRMRIADACDLLLEACEEDLLNGDRRRRTWDHDRTYMAVLKEQFGDVYVDEFTEEYWSKWVRTTGKKLGRNLFDVAKYLSKLLTLCHQIGLIQRKPKIRNPDRFERKGRVFTPAEIRRLVEVSPTDLRLQIVLGFENGMRPGEIRGLQWDMLVWSTHSVVLKLPIWLVKTGSKFGHGREIQVSRRAFEMLREGLKKPTRNATFVFPAPKEPGKGMSDVHQSRLFKRACLAAGIKGPARMYDLRHSFYTIALLEKGLPIQAVSEFGGTSIGTLQRHYLHGDAKRTSHVASAVSINMGDEETRGK